MAVVLAFPATAVFEVIVEEGRDDSYYLDLISKLAHFIFVQVAALLAAFLAAAFPHAIVSLVSLIVLLYAISTAAMTALALFDVAMIYNRSQSPKE
jgi:hypothetical protein